MKDRIPPTLTVKERELAKWFTDSQRNVKKKFYVGFYHINEVGNGVSQMNIYKILYTKRKGKGHSPVEDYMLIGYSLIPIGADWDRPKPFKQFKHIDAKAYRLMTIFDTFEEAIEGLKDRYWNDLQALKKSYSGLLKIR